MSIPELIPVKRKKDDFTHFVGHTKEGLQFFGYEVYVFPNGVPSLDWKKHRKEYVVLFIFDDKGNLIKTNHHYAGTSFETSEVITRKKLEQMVDELGKVTYRSIDVKPFKSVIDGFIFGLIINREDQTVDLEPSSILSFGDPWDGDYDN